MTQRSSAISAAVPAGDASDPGTVFAHALARLDFQTLSALLHPEIEFRALTPRRAWAPEDRGAVIEVLRTWFDGCDIEEIVQFDTDAFAGRRRVAYRFRGQRPEGQFVIEQQVYFTERDRQIDWMRVLCSGFRVP